MCFRPCVEDGLGPYRDCGQAAIGQHRQQGGGTFERIRRPAQRKGVALHRHTAKGSGVATRQQGMCAVQEEGGGAVGEVLAGGHNEALAVRGKRHESDFL